MTPENGIIYITECIDSIGDYRSVVKADPYETYAITSVDSHLEWLTKVLKNLQDFWKENFIHIMQPMERLLLWEHCLVLKKLQMRLMMKEF